MRISDWSSDVCSSDLAAGTGADLDVLQRVELLEDRAACGIDDHQRAGRGTAPGRVGKERNLPRHVRTAVVADEDHLPRLLGLHAHAQQARSEEHTSELQSLMRISYAVFCLKKKQTHTKTHETKTNTHRYSIR